MYSQSFFNLQKWMKDFRPWISKNMFYLNKKKYLNFTLMSYNILCQNVMLMNPSLYTKCPENVLEWPARGLRIMDEILIVNPDILCFQEANFEHYTNFFVPNLSTKGYKSIYKQKHGKTDGCAIFYKFDKFELIKKREVSYFRQDICNLLDKPNVGLIALLKPLFSNSDNYLVVGTTHLLFNPERSDIKLQQMRLFLAELKEIAYKSFCFKKNTKIYHPLIICGDFNFEPNSILYYFINDGFLNLQDNYIEKYSSKDGYKRIKNLDYKDIVIGGVNFNSEFSNNKTEINDLEKNVKIIKHDLNLKNVFYFETKSSNFITTRHDKSISMVDYIFYNKNKNLKFIGKQKLINRQVIKNLIPYLPNDFLGSDHFSLTVKFLLKKK